MEELIVRYIHFVGIISLSSMLAIENVLLADKLKAEVVRKLALVDVIYGVSAIVTLTAGLLLWFVVGKPSQFYTGNPLFHAKLGLFIFIALMSAVPTQFILRARRSEMAETVVPGRIILIKRVEAGLLLLLPLLAVLMARGIGNS